METNKLQNRDKFFEDEVSLKEIVTKIKNYFFYLIGYKKIILIAFVFSFILGYLYFIKQTIKYKAEINFVLDDEKQSGMNGANIVASQLGLDLGSNTNGIFSGDNLIYLFKSRMIIEKTLLTKLKIDNKIKTIADFYLQAEFPKKYNDDIFTNNNPNQLNRDQILALQVIRSEILKNILEVKQKEKKVSVTTIEVISKNEKFSKIFCEQLAKNVSSFYIETRSKKARLNKDILQKQVDSVRQELNQAIDGVARANDQSYNFNPAYLVTKTNSTKHNIDIQANTAILTQLVANLEMAKVALRKETPLIQVIDYPILPLDEVKFSLIFIEIIFGIISLFLAIIYLTFFKLSKKP